MDSNGFLCVFIGPYGSLWVLVRPYPSSRVSIGFMRVYDFLWVLMGLYTRSV